MRPLPGAASARVIAVTSPRGGSPARAVLPPRRTAHQKWPASNALNKAESPRSTFEPIAAESRRRNPSASCKTSSERGRLAHGKSAPALAAQQPQNITARQPGVPPSRCGCPPASDTARQARHARSRESSSSTRCSEPARSAPKNVQNRSPTVAGWVLRRAKRLVAALNVERTGR